MLSETEEESRYTDNQTSPKRARMAVGQQLFTGDRDPPTPPPRGASAEPGDGNDTDDTDEYDDSAPPSGGVRWGDVRIREHSRELLAPDKTSANSVGLGWARAPELIRRMSSFETERAPRRFERGQPTRLPSDDRALLCREANEEGPIVPEEDARSLPAQAQDYWWLDGHGCLHLENGTTTAPVVEVGPSIYARTSDNREYALGRPAREISQVIEEFGVPYDPAHPLQEPISLVRCAALAACTTERAAVESALTALFARLGVTSEDHRLHGQTMVVRNALRDLIGSKLAGDGGQGQVALDTDPDGLPNAPTVPKMPAPVPRAPKIAVPDEGNFSVESAGSTPRPAHVALD